jgi:hypothetical protein
LKVGKDQRDQEERKVTVVCIDRHATKARLLMLNDRFGYMKMELWMPASGPI